VPCTSPRTVGFQHDGKTLAWSSKNYSKEYATFQLPCSKCIECRLDYARQWAVRCVHEAQMHESNVFVTLTYSDENLKSPRLIYKDFQNFMKKLRKLQNDPISFFVTGEYGEKQKRPHWHAIIFNWAPRDGKHFRTTDKSHKVFTSETLTNLWGHGHTEYGSVTLESAGYCARYAAKKLVHGKDEEHDYHPISKKSSKHAIGKKWLEKYWPDIFNHGRCILDGGVETAIPRYYEKWFKEKHPDLWIQYVSNIKLAKLSEASEKKARELQDYLKNLEDRGGFLRPRPLTNIQIRKKIQDKKFEELQKHLKL